MEIFSILYVFALLVDIDIAPGFINTKYECLRPTPHEPKHNRKLVSLLLILERKRQLDNEDKRSLSYRHAISAIKVRIIYFILCTHYNNVLRHILER
jgi:hypothetical protein